MKTILLLALFAAKATWTGRFERVTLYDHTEGISCQYAPPIGRDLFWLTFRGYDCPATVPVP